MKTNHTLLLVAAMAFATLECATAQSTDTTIIFQPANADLLRHSNYRPQQNAWGLDLMISNNGFGLGGFTRHEFTEEFSGLAGVSISDVKDDAEVERFTPFGQSYVYGKKNRLLHIPFHISAQYRLFREEIVDNFRPFIAAGLGPSMLYVAPYTRITTYANSTATSEEQVDFFESLKYGKAHWTLSGYVGIGANFGLDKATLTGISLRYYFIPYPQGIEVLEGVPVKEFGGFYILINIGSFY